MTVPAGFLIVDKPQGATSFSIVALVRRLTGVRRVGHAGTLDPLATGVLPIALGHATRLIEYLDEERKVYVARVRFGVETDTYDAEGKVVATSDASKLAASDIEAALPSFVGDLDQVPPAHSALKVAGQPLYRYARAGVDLALRPRHVRIDAIALRSFADGEAEIEVRCGKGTYVRSLAHDLGQALGTGAHLSGLRRTASGGFRIEEAHAREELVDAAATGRLADLLLAPDRAVERLGAAILEERHSRDVREGRPVALHVRKRVSAGEMCRAYTAGGEFVAVLRAQPEGLWKPEKVLIKG